MHPIWLVEEKVPNTNLGSVSFHSIELEFENAGDGGREDTLGGKCRLVGTQKNQKLKERDNTESRHGQRGGGPRRSENAG